MDTDEYIHKERIGYFAITDRRLAIFLRAEHQPQALVTEDTETKPEDTEDLEVFASESCLCDLWLGLCALGDKVWDVVAAAPRCVPIWAICGPSS